VVLYGVRRCWVLNLVIDGDVVVGGGSGKGRDERDDFLEEDGGTIMSEFTTVPHFHTPGMPTFGAT